MTRKWGSAYSWVGRLLDIRDGHACFICGKGDGLIVGHLDDDEADMDPDNLRWFCWSHNQKWKGRTRGLVPQKEREPQAHERKEWSSKEGERHDTMRFLWDNLLYHPKAGLLAVEGARVSKSKLPSKAIDFIGYGSSKTTAWYQKEDLDNGYLRETRDEDGTPLVERTAKPFPPSKLGMKS